MIITSIQYCQRYAALHRDFQTAFEIIREHLNAADAGNTIHKDGLSSSVWRSATSDFEADGSPKVLEAHRKAIDIHFIVEGEEGFACEHIDRLSPVTSYNDAQDYLFLSGNASKVILRRGDLVIVYPEDAHRTAMDSGSKAGVTRGVIKVTL